MKFKNVSLGFLMGFLLIYPLTFILEIIVMYTLWRWDWGFLFDMAIFRIGILMGIIGAVVGGFIE